MNTPDDLSQYYAELLDGVYDCVDRIVLNAFFPLGQTGGGMRSWWRSLHGDDSHLDDKHLREMAGTFSRRLRAFCAKQGIPIIEAGSGERKHELAEPQVPRDPTFRGLFLVITGNAPAPIWEVKRNTDGRITEIRHRKNWPFVKHYYFHIMDHEWGHVTIRMCGYPPFGAQLILNGHEWVEREARRKCLTTVKNGNCFVEGSDFDAVNRVAARLHQENAIGRLHGLWERWIYSTCLCFALTHEEQKRIGFAYQYSVFQLELSRNLLFLPLTQVAEAVQQRAGRSLKAYSSRNAAYDLAKLKGKKLVHRVKGSRRYKAEPSGVQSMCAYLILRDKVIKPLLAGVVRPFGRAPKVQAPVDQHYIRLREELNRTFETIGLAPA
jgi:CRISPR/Cas system-associated endoribonuclease Cas2